MLNRVDKEMKMEQSHSENTKRLAKNTLMLYSRMLFGMFVSLYTSRVVLNALGVVDYGIFGAVGGFVSMFSLISNSLSSAVSRFLTFELGGGDMYRLKRAFSTSLLIHILLAFVILLVAETVGIWFVNHRMTIPPDRLYAANWVFQASILSFMFGLFSVPYNASIVSHERMSAFAYIGILDTTLKLIIVLFVANARCHFDKLIVYSILLTAVSILLQLIYLIYCRNHFEECRLRLSFDKEFWKDISAFSMWNFIGCSASILKDQGVNVLLNMFVGPVLNAARGIAGSVNNAVASFAGNFMAALNPQITKSFASGDLTYAHFLVERGSRFSFYIMLFLALPILLETEFILTLWLTEFPEHTSHFVRLVLVLSLLEVLSTTLIILQNATGNIRNYQLVVGTTLLLNFPLSYICLKSNLEPESTYIVAIVVSVMCMFARLLFVHRTAALSISSFVRNVVLNVILVTICAMLFPYIAHAVLPYGWERFVIVSIISVCMSAISIFFIGCSRNERVYISTRILAIISRFFGGVYQKNIKD